MPLLLMLVVLPLAGCGGSQDVLHPHSHPARDIASLFWWMTVVAFIGLALVTGLLVAAWVRRKRRAGEGPHPSDRAGWAVVLGLGFAMPLAVVIALFVVSTQILKTTEAPAASATSMTVHVVAHQWWWEIRYPGTTAVTANELHIPVDTPVNLVATSADVIHSFWVPELNRKIDTIPGQRNRIELYADTPGVYRGQCAEYCGIEHAHMSLKVFAQRPAQFRAWLARESRPALAPKTAVERLGRRVFLSGPCSSCHTIRGTSASGTTGPDLTHVGSRTTLGAVTVANTRAELERWISRSQSLKPGNQMPDIPLPGPQLRAVATYLESLK